MIKPVQVFPQIVDSLVHFTERDALSQYITRIATFMKTWYKHHILRTSDDCVTHDMKYIMGDILHIVIQLRHPRRQRQLVLSVCYLTIYMMN